MQPLAFLCDQCGGTGEQADYAAADVQHKNRIDRIADIPGSSRVYVKVSHPQKLRIGVTVRHDFRNHQIDRR